MSAHCAAHRSSALVDPTRCGSGLGQIAVGILGVVLAGVLVIGQISLATTRGIQQNLGGLIANMDDGNRTMEQIVAKSRPSIQMEKNIGKQAELLASTRDAMVVTNAEMAKMLRTVDGLGATVDRMRATSQRLSSGVSGMQSDTDAVAGMLEPLPAGARRTHRHLARIKTDSHATNVELRAIGGKMQRYGLPHAKGVAR